MLLSIAQQSQPAIATIASAANINPAVFKFPRFVRISFGGTVAICNILNRLVTTDAATRCSAVSWCRIRPKSSAVTWARRSRRVALQDEQFAVLWLIAEPTSSAGY